MTMTQISSEETGSANASLRSEASSGSSPVAEPAGNYPHIGAHLPEPLASDTCYIAAALSWYDGSGASDDVRAAWKRIIDALTAAVWQPIETAPRDGTRVLIVMSGDAAHPPIVGEAYWYVSDEVADADWWWANTGPGEYFSDNVLNSQHGQITHWRPLPAPPASPADPNGPVPGKPSNQDHPQ